MANRDNTGFRLAKDIEYVIRRFPVDASNSTIVYVGDVMANNAAGSVRPAAANAAATAVGICVGVYDSKGLPCGSRGSSVTTKGLPISTAGFADVALALPSAIFIAQGQTGYTPTVADIWVTCDHVAGAGVAALGISGHELSMTSLNTEGQFQILGIVDEPGNAWGENVDVYVRFNESVFGQTGSATGV